MHPSKRVLIFINVTVCRNDTGGCRPRLIGSASISITLLKLERTRNRSVRFEVLTASVKKTLLVFWGVTSCVLEKVADPIFKF